MAWHAPMSAADNVTPNLPGGQAALSSLLQVTVMFRPATATVQQAASQADGTGSVWVGTEHVAFRKHVTWVGRRRDSCLQCILASTGQIKGTQALSAWLLSNPTGLHYDG